MKRIKLPRRPAARRAGAILLLLLAFAVGRYGCGRQPPAPAPHDDHAPAPARPARMYTCSMHPQVRSPDPDAKCPICAMDLIPVPQTDEEDDAETAAPRLRLSAQAAALMDIQTWPVRRQAVEIEIPLWGQIGFDESRLYDVVARTDAYIEQLIVNTPWQAVKKGDPLAELYSPAAGIAMRELRVARSSSEATREATRARLLRLGVPAAQIAQIEDGDAALPRTFRLESPVDGVVATFDAREGDWLREGERLLRLADLSHVWVNLAAYESDLPWLQTGLSAQFTVSGLPGQTFDGQVSFMEPVLDNRCTVRLRIEAPNPDGAFRPGLFVSASVRAPYPGATNPLVIPASAPLITGRRALVYVRLPDRDRPTFEARPVTLGPRAGDLYIVTDGLNAGEEVVVNGQFKIDSELQIRGRPSMMSAAAPEAPAPADAIRLQTECPVMGGAINPELYVDTDGYRIFVCCPGCDEAVLADPQKYIAQMTAEGITPYRLQTHCPIMDLPIDRDLYHDHDGQRIYVCCAGCLDEVRERAAAIIAAQRERGIVFESVEP